SNFNFLIGEMYAGRIVYPLFAPDEIAGWEGPPRQFAYAASNCENSWFSFFKPLSYYDGDSTHADTKLVKSLPATWGEFATPEFRFTAQVMRLFTRDDFSDWRHAVHRTVQSRIAVVDDIREAIDSMLGRMGGRKIGVHVRHPSHFVEQGRVFFRDYFAAVDR